MKIPDQWYKLIGKLEISLMRRQQFSTLGISWSLGKMTDACHLYPFIRFHFAHSYVSLAYIDDNGWDEMYGD